MSGTSLDGIDAVLADFAPGDGRARCSRPPTSSFRASCAASSWRCQDSGDDEIVRAARAANALADLYAHALALRVPRRRTSSAHDVVAAGVHGQTVRHRPHEGWTLQINNPVARCREAPT